MHSLHALALVAALAWSGSADAKRRTVKTTETRTEQTTTSSGAGAHVDAVKDGVKSLLGGFGSFKSESGSTSNRTSTSKTTTVEETRVRINGVDVDEEPQRAPRRQNRGGDFGATCVEMDDCATRLCVVPRDNGRTVGFCSKTCDSWSDCPSHWECQRLRNTAQKVCVPPRD
jgi:hypothetical protein